MKISFVEIQNYRKLKSCRIAFSKKTTVLVGSNNSGKTSAMFALKNFLKERKLSLDDFTISNLPLINRIGNYYLRKDDKEPLSMEIWSPITPSIDVWIDVAENEMRYVANILPSLDWHGGLIGIRLVYEPVDLEKMCATYKKAYELARSHQKSDKLRLWPTNMCDFLREQLRECFEMHAYILDEAKIEAPKNNDSARPQKISTDAMPLDFDPFKNLIRIDFNPAQKGLDDASDDIRSDTKPSNNLLSDQLRKYYDKQLDPERQPTQADIKTLIELQEAREAFDKQIKTKFKNSMEELSRFGYPGNYNPNIIIESKAQTNEIISHNTIVRYPLFEDDDEQYKLPEKYNGLGYQNLISMSFKLMSFRDSWLNGEKNQKSSLSYEQTPIQPIHLVLLEEPEAHLHVQVQQVFVKNAYELLRNHSLLKGKTPFSTQLIISTHSSNVALESEFVDLRYFKRIREDNLPISVVANLSEVFGPNKNTTKFVKRYLKATHCDLFFADAVIMVEGAGERILLPHFIRNSSNALNQAYISILEINGRHAHTLKPLIEKLGIACLVITDLDIVDANTKKSTPYKADDRQITTNYTLTDWVPKEKSVDKLLSLSFKDKEVAIEHSADGFVRVAYQSSVKLAFSDKSEHTFIPTTFEDALAYENFKYFRGAGGAGGIKKFVTAFKEEDVDKISKKVYEILYGNGDSRSNFSKAEFAMDLLMIKDPASLKTPAYISEALTRLSEFLTSRNKSDFLESEGDKSCAK